MDTNRLTKTAKKEGFGLGKWVYTIMVTLLCIGLGFLVAGFKGAIAMGCLSILMSLTLLVSCVPFIGIYLYWRLGNFIGDTIIDMAGLNSSTYVHWIKMMIIVLFGIYAVIIWILFTVLAVIVIVALLSALW